MSQKARLMIIVIAIRNWAKQRHDVIQIFLRTHVTSYGETLCKRERDLINIALHEVIVFFLAIRQETIV